MQRSDKPKESTGAAPDPMKTAGRKVQGRKMYYNKVYAESLDLFINSSYSSLGKLGPKVVIRQEGKIKTQVHAVKVRNIVIAGNGISLSSDVIKFCCEKNIRISFHDGFGKPYAIITPDYSPLSGVSRAQVEALTGLRGKTVAKSLISSKIKNQMATIKFFIKNKRESAQILEQFEGELKSMAKLAEEVELLSINLPIEELRKIIFGLEGSAAVSYWKMVRVLLPKDWNFSEREHQNAENPVNILLNYGYGILYSRVLNAVSTAGLNPYISFLHAEQKNKPTLVFDMIEEFRAPLVDRVIIGLLRKGSNFKVTNNRLSDISRKKVAEKILIRLNSDVLYRGERLTHSDILLVQMKEVIRFIRGEDKVFKPFLFKW